MPFIDQIHYTFGESNQINQRSDDPLKVLIFIQEGDHSGDTSKMISNLLVNGLKLSEQDYHVVALKGDTNAVGRLMHTSHAKLCISFGVSFRDLGLKINAPAYYLTQLTNSNIIVVDSPNILEADRNKKLKLWNAIKDLKFD